MVDSILGFMQSQQHADFVMLTQALRERLFVVRQTSAQRPAISQKSQLRWLEQELKASEDTCRNVTHATNYRSLYRPPVAYTVRRGDAVTALQRSCLRESSDSLDERGRLQLREGIEIYYARTLLFNAWQRARNARRRSEFISALFGNPPAIHPKPYFWRYFFLLKLWFPCSPEGWIAQKICRSTCDSADRVLKLNAHLEDF